MAVSTTSFDWVNGHTRSPATAGYDWMAELTIEELTAPTKDLQLYVDYSFMIGPHTTETGRQDTASIFHTQVATGGGGQLASAIKAFYYPSQWAAGAAVAQEFLSRRIADFVRERVAGPTSTKSTFTDMSTMLSIYREGPRGEPPLGCNGRL